MENERLEKALAKIKYDIIYIQNLRMDKSENYTIDFRKTVSNGVTVLGIDKQFDYVCYNDLNNDGFIELSEVITDPFTNKKMMYIFDKDSNYGDKIFNNIRLNSNSFNYLSGMNTRIRFNQIGGIQVFNGINFSNEMNIKSTIEISLYTNPNARKKLVIYPITTDMLIRDREE